VIVRWLFASVHLLALPLGLGAVWARSRALSSLQQTREYRRAFLADNLWGFAAFLWISTGLVRAFAGLEKGSSYYLHDRMFIVKMSLLGVILLLEIWPMVTLIRWRMAVGKGAAVDTTVAPGLARISRIQAGIVVLMVFAATALARGFFY
jgi:putative membrane protein